MSSKPVDPEAIDLETYAELSARLARAPQDRDAILASHGLDEDRWSVIDERLQAELSAAIDRDEGDGVPDEVARYSAAGSAQAAGGEGGGATVPIEHFAEATRKIQQGVAPAAALASLGLTFAQFIEATSYWTRKMIEDEPSRERYMRILQGSSD